MNTAFSLKRYLSVVLAGLLTISLCAVPAYAEETPEVHVHAWSTTITPASCTVPGLEQSVCGTCGESLEAVIPATGHSYAVTGSLDPTEEAEGYIEYTCDTCGDTYRETLPPLTPATAEPAETEELPAEEDVPTEGGASEAPAASDDPGAQESAPAGTAGTPSRSATVYVPSNYIDRSGSYVYSYGTYTGGTEYYVDQLAPEDLLMFGQRDPGYTGSAITNLTEVEKQSLINAMIGEQGASLAGCIFVAQVLHDQYLYLGGQLGSFSTVERMLTTGAQWDPAYWSPYERNPNHIDTANAEFAFDYVFNRGNAFVQHSLFVEILAYGVSWDPRSSNSAAEKIAAVHTYYADGSSAGWTVLWGIASYDSDGRYAGQINPNAAVEWNVGARLETKEDIQQELMKILYNRAEAALTCDFDGYETILGRHEGIDFCAGAGAPIYALTSGEILNVYRSDILTSLAVYDEENDKTVVYLHADFAPELAAGARLERGGWIGTEGANGASAAHTHVEVVDGRSAYARISVAQDKAGSYYWQGLVLENDDPYPYWVKVLSAGTREEEQEEPVEPEPADLPREPQKKMKDRSGEQEPTWEPEAKRTKDQQDLLV